MANDAPSTSSMVGSGRPCRRLLLFLLLLHATLLVVMSITDSPIPDECGHLVAGITYWRYGDFRTYEVNPPLTKLIAALPAALWASDTPFVTTALEPRARIELWNLLIFRARHDKQLATYTHLGRLLCIPFALLGALVCWYWARDLYGERAASFALVLWAFSPSMLGHGHLMTADVAAAAMNLAALYLFCVWLRYPDLSGAFVWGVVLGLALLTKFTLVILPPLMILVWTIRFAFAATTRNTWLREILFVGFGFAMALLTVNLGYGFSGSGKRLGDYVFSSRLFTGESAQTGSQPGNRWRESWLGKLPVPLPSNYLTGIDAQQWDFERPLPSYLHGEWLTGGRWYFYLYGLLIKEPWPSWVLLGMALVAPAICRRRDKNNDKNNYHAKPSNTLPRFDFHRFDERVLLLTSFVYLAFVSSKTGFTMHVRYAWIVLPPLWVFTSRLVQYMTDTVPVASKWYAGMLRYSVGALISWQITSVLFCYPHLISYFSEVIGGPRNGGYYLADSNVSWSQDVYRLKAYLRRHRILVFPIAFAGDKVSWLLDQPIEGLLCDCHFWKDILKYDEYMDTPFPVTARYTRHPLRDYLRAREPVAWIGYSILIYRIDRRVLDVLCGPEASTPAGTANQP